MAILTVDAIIAALLLAVSTAVFLSALDTFDLSMREVVAQRFADELALALQKQHSALSAFHSGNSAEMTEQIQRVTGSYCVEVKTNSNSLGSCAGNKVTRKFIVFDGRELFETTLAIYFA